jgi:hypothetical protein
MTAAMDQQREIYERKQEKMWWNQLALPQKVMTVAQIVQMNRQLGHLYGLRRRCDFMIRRRNVQAKLVQIPLTKFPVAPVFDHESQLPGAKFDHIKEETREHEPLKDASTLGRDVDVTSQSSWNGAGQTGWLQPSIKAESTRGPWPAQQRLEPLLAPLDSALLDGGSEVRPTQNPSQGGQKALAEMPSPMQADIGMIHSGMSNTSRNRPQVDTQWHSILETSQERFAVSEPATNARPDQPSEIATEISTVKRQQAFAGVDMTLQGSTMLHGEQQGEDAQLQQAELSISPVPHRTQEASPNSSTLTNCNRSLSGGSGRSQIDDSPATEPQDAVELLSDLLTQDSSDRCDDVAKDDASVHQIDTPQKSLQLSNHSGSSTRKFESSVSHDDEKDTDAEDESQYVNALCTMISTQRTSDDTRRCMLCKGHGDTPVEGRLLYAGIDGWVHLNCAMWSSETYEHERGELSEVYKAVSLCFLCLCEHMILSLRTPSTDGCCCCPQLARAPSMQCAFCGRSGATVGCNNRMCKHTYHFSCALQAGCVFLKSQKIFCKEHKHTAYCDARLLHTVSDFHGVSGNRMLTIVPREQESARQIQAIHEAIVNSTRPSLGQCGANERGGLKGTTTCLLRVGALMLVDYGRVIFGASGFHTNNR